MMWDGMAGMGAIGWLWMLLGVVFVVALLVLIVLTAVWLVRSAGGDGTAPQVGPPGASSAAGSPREALDLRYARGEISREEHQQALRDLADPGARRRGPTAARED